MYRACAGLVVASCVVLTLGAEPAAAQRLSKRERAVQQLTQDGPFPGFERTDRDLGTWDAVLIGSTYFERRTPARFVEINEPGCDGTCVSTRLVNQSAPWWPMAQSWWQYAAFTGFGGGAPASELSHSGVNASSWVGDIHTAVIDTPKGRKAVMVDVNDPRVEVDYPAPGERLVTVYGETASSGRQVPLLRIVYTRRP